MIHLAIKGHRLCIARRDAEGNWSWDYCPDCGRKGAHHGEEGVRCG